MFGQLAGDSLGSLVEFKSASQIAKLYPDGVRDLKDGGTFNLIAGQSTDDGEMALALARTIVQNGTFDRGSVAEAYIRWWMSAPFDIGFTTKSGIVALSNGRMPTSDSQANGALMRVSPIGVFAAGAPALAATAGALDAELTHPHPVCLSANAAFTAAIAVGIAGADAQTMWQAATEYADYHPGSEAGAVAVRERLELARISPPREFYDNMGWVLTAFQNAFYHLLSGETLEEAVVWTVGKGGDTDTNAAICGALLGAVQGRTAIPGRWIDDIEACRPSEKADVVHPRPHEYWPADANVLAEALLSARLQEVS
ncbi:ADP-ribosylglycohydrolase family protein [Roseibium sp.]|uniref:ADP-ribosylglycohydrolase family protein n=1 Tax=Roseibium sp. TaxID=1936156 RepID=UPI0026189E96|nr:ADP-ribosylglycohydrolase family protein [Roseibium sp.]